jgi:hypothetical protein
MAMQLEQAAARRSKAHKRYKAKDGGIVPGVTTVLGVMDKPALKLWANRLGLQGIDVTKYTDSLADIGTITHEYALCYFNKATPDFSDYPPTLVAAAQPCIAKFHAWLNKHKVEPKWTEKEMVSEEHRFGGCFDFYGKIDGVWTIADFKTAKAVYDEHWYQLAAYGGMLIEYGNPVDQAMVVQIGRSEDEGFSDPVKTDLANGWKIFLHCLAIYNLKKKKQ